MAKQDSRQQPAVRPNILIILSDPLRRQALGSPTPAPPTLFASPSDSHL